MTFSLSIYPAEGKGKPCYFPFSADLTTILLYLPVTLTSKVDSLRK